MGASFDLADPYRGTEALEVTIPNWPREMVLLAIDIWEDRLSLRGTAALDRTAPVPSPPQWRIVTSQGAVYDSGGRGGGGSSPHRWHVEFDQLPDGTAAGLALFVAHQEGDALEDPRFAPVVALAQPALLQRTSINACSVERIERPERGAASERLARAIAARGVRPDSVIAVSTRLDIAPPREISVLSIANWPSCFDLHIGGRGPWPDAISLRQPHIRQRWSALDDRGNEYRGHFRGGHGGTTWMVEAAFEPRLDPAARSLDLELPHPFETGHVLRTRVDLPSPSIR